MTSAEANAHAEGITLYLKNNFGPAEAMYVLSKLVAQMLNAATPVGGMAKSVELFMEGVGAELRQEGGLLQ